MSQSASKMLEKFGLKFLKLIYSGLHDKPTEEVIKICGDERDRIDSAIKFFRERVEKPSKIERRYFNSLKEERTKLQHEIRIVRRASRRRKEKELHEKLDAMTKNELKDWRVMSHKLHNMYRNLDSIHQKLKELDYSRFQNQRDKLVEETNQLNQHLDSYKVIMHEIQDIMTKNYYEDLNTVNQHKASTSETIR